MWEDEVAWENIQQGDNKALKKLFELYYKPLCTFALQFTHNIPDAEDLVQGEYVKLWARRNELEIHSSIKSYLYKSVYNAFMLQLREEKQRDKFFDLLKYEAMTYRLDEDSEDHAGKVEKIKKIVNLLPERCREILLLSKREGYKNREIAEELGVSIKTVESQIRIAFKKIRDNFNEDKLVLFVLFKSLCRMDPDPNKL